MLANVRGDEPAVEVDATAGSSPDGQTDGLALEWLIGRLGSAFNSYATRSHRQDDDECACSKHQGHSLSEATPVIQSGT